MASKRLRKEVLETNESPTLNSSEAVVLSASPESPVESSVRSPSVRGAARSLNGASDEEATASWGNKYFFEDEVYKFDKRGRVIFGLVTDTAESDESDEDDESKDSIPAGKLQVTWYPGGCEEITSESNLGLADRTLMPGDVVRRSVDGRDTQRGFVREIHMHADLKILGTKFILCNVKTDRLRPLSKWCKDNAVCLDSWVGSIRDVEDKAILMSSQGSRIQISSVVYHSLCDPTNEGLYSVHPMFYAGNVVMGRFHSMENIKLLTPDNPLKMASNGRPLPDRFVIEEVSVDNVWVNWQCKALSQEDQAQASVLVQPKAVVSGEELKRLKPVNLFDAVMLQLNDRVYVKYSPDDQMMRRSEWSKVQSAKYRERFTDQWKREPFAESSASVANTSTQSEKSRKKATSHETTDRGSTKPKKFTPKSDKGSGSGNKEKGVTIEESVESSADTRNTSPKQHDSSWVTDEDADVHEDADTLDECPGRKRDEEDYEAEQPRSSPKGPGRSVPKKKAFRKKPVLTQERVPLLTQFRPVEGEEYIAEAVMVRSVATVVWQDGTVEVDIPSTDLFPIHHLDNHEFFPGDFVISGDIKKSFREYGVIQSVDHHGRIARVKWFDTYTSIEEPSPIFKGESEVSVYDLRDHPDFQYRPGVMVIRVANFVGVDEHSTAGQIVETTVEGRVKVLWVDGHTSLSWPQDLFEVAQYNENDWEGDSEGSWETESEETEYGSDSDNLKVAVFEESHLLKHIKKSQQAIGRLETLFRGTASLQEPEALQRLMSVYKGYRNLDSLMETKFFDLDHYKGLLEPVRHVDQDVELADASQKDDDASSAGNDGASGSPKGSADDAKYKCHYHAIVAVHHDPTVKLDASVLNQTTNEYAPKVLFNLSSTPNRYKSAICKDLARNRPGEDQSVTNSPSSPTVASLSELIPDKEPIFDSATDEVNYLLNKALHYVEEARVSAENLRDAGMLILPSQDDSGNFTRTEAGDASSENTSSNSVLSQTSGERDDNEKEAKNANESDVVAVDHQVDAGAEAVTDENGTPKGGKQEQQEAEAEEEEDDDACDSVALNPAVSPEEACGRLCSLLEQQIKHLVNDINEKYYKSEDDDYEVVYTGGDILTDNKVSSTNAAEDAAMTAKADADSDEEAKTEEETIEVLLKHDSKMQAKPMEVDSPEQPQVCEVDCFLVLPAAPRNHKFHAAQFVPNNTKQYFKAVVREHKMLKASLPPGVWVRTFEDRLDLLSVMIAGPKNTPYEDGLFLFDFQLGRDYPKSPPACHYISHCSDRLNPNLYEDGKVCVSLLGTWSGRDSEVWGPTSTLLQVIVSIQGLILVDEPYYNEAGYEKQKETYEGRVNSRMYNEMAIIKLVQSTVRMLQNPSELFRSHILAHYKERGYKMYTRIQAWIKMSQDGVYADIGHFQPQFPTFPLLPGSRGFCLSLEGLLENFKKMIDEIRAVPEEGPAAGAPADEESKQTG